MVNVVDWHFREDNFLHCPFDGHLDGHLDYFLDFDDLIDDLLYNLLDGDLTIDMNHLRQAG